MARPPRCRRPNPPPPRCTDRSRSVVRMVAKLYTEAELDALRLMPKRIANPRARWSEKPGARPAHRQRSFSGVWRRRRGSALPDLSAAESAGRDGFLVRDFIPASRRSAAGAGGAITGRAMSTGTSSTARIFIVPRRLPSRPEGRPRPALQRRSGSRAWMARWPV